MKTILKAIPWLLLLSVLCGCSYHTTPKPSSFLIKVKVPYRKILILTATGN